MKTPQGILFLIMGICLSASAVMANEQGQNKDLTKASDLVQLSEQTSSSRKPALPVVNKFAGELRTTTRPGTGKVAVNKSDLSKTMLSKFRINGI